MNRKFLYSLLIFSLFSQFSLSKISSVNIGVLVPISLNGEKNPWGIDSWSAIVMAFNEINNKADGIADTLLPDTQLNFTFYDTGSLPGKAVLHTLNMIHSSFDNRGVNAIIGPALSSESKVVGLLTNTLKIPQISYSSTSSQFSNPSSYGYFVRTCPSDDFQTNAIIDFLKYLNWVDIALFYGNDAYGSDGGSAIISAASTNGINVYPISFNVNSTDFSSHLSSIIQNNIKVILLYVQSSDAANILKQAYEYGIVGNGYQWIGTDAVTTVDTWNTFGLDTDDIMTGYIGFTAVNGKGNKEYSSFISRWKNQNPTILNEICSDEMDHDGKPLWKSSFGCFGIDFNKKDLDTLDSYSPFAYDAVYAIAHGIEHLIKQAKTKIDGRELYEAIINDVSFDGVTGPIDFHEGEEKNGLALFRQGDRTTNGMYHIWNWHSGSLNLVSSWPNNLRRLSLSSLVFANGKSSDALSCEAGEYYSNSSKTCEYCPAGSYELLSGVRYSCTLCPRGQYNTEIGSVNCFFCNSTSYSSQLGSTSCHNCPSNTEIPDIGESLKNCTCKEDYYSLQGTGTPCSSCPDGGICEGGTKQPYPAPGYWGDKDFPKEFYACSLATCDGGENFSCSTGWSERMCVFPADGYFLISTYNFQCPSNPYLARLLMLFLEFLTVCMWVFVNDIASGASNAVNITLLFAQMIALFATFGLSWNTNLSLVFSFFSLLMFDVSLVNPHCVIDIGFFGIFFVQLGLPLIFATYRYIAMAVSFKLYQLTKRTYDEETIRNSTLSSALSFASACYPTLTLYSLYPLNCTLASDSNEYLVFFPYFECWTFKHICCILIGLGYFCTVILGMPFQFTYRIVWQGYHRHKLHTPRYLQRYGFLYTNYESKYLFWGVFIMLRLLTMCMIVALLSSYPLLQAALAMVIMSASTALHFFARPFLVWRIDIMEMISLYSLTFFLFSGPMFYAEFEYSNSLAYLLIIMVLFTVSVSSVVTFLDIRDLASTARARDVRIQKSQQFKANLEPLRVTVSRASKLLTGDFATKPDPYVLVQVGLESQSTRALENTSKPVFNEVFGFSNIPKTGNIEIEFTVMDRDVITQDDLIGKCIHVVRAGQPYQFPPTWMELTDDNFNVAGRLLISIFYEPSVSAKNASLTESITKLLEDEDESSELEGTLKGPQLLLWAKSDKRTLKDFEDFMYLEKWLQPFVSDDAPTSEFSHQGYANFFRSFLQAFPNIIDFLSLKNAHEHAIFRQAIANLYMFVEQGSNGGAYTKILNRNDRPGISYWLLMESNDEQRQVFAQFMRNIVTSDADYHEVIKKRRLNTLKTNRNEKTDQSINERIKQFSVSPSRNAVHRERLRAQSNPNNQIEMKEIVPLPVPTTEPNNNSTEM